MFSKKNTVLQKQVVNSILFWHFCTICKKLTRSNYFCVLISLRLCLCLTLLTVKDSCNICITWMFYNFQTGTEADPEGGTCPHPYFHFPIPLAERLRYSNRTVNHCNKTVRVFIRQFTFTIKYSIRIIILCISNIHLVQDSYLLYRYCCFLFSLFNF